jgi:hypothetical protein
MHRCPARDGLIFDIDPKTKHATNFRPANHQFKSIDNMPDLVYCIYCRTVFVKNGEEGWDSFQEKF